MVEGRQNYQSSDSSKEQDQPSRSPFTQVSATECWSRSSNSGFSSRNGSGTEASTAIRDGQCTNGECLNVPPVFNDGRRSYGAPAKSVGELPVGVYDENRTVAAVQDAKAQNKPVVSLLIGEGLDPKTLDTINKYKNDVNFVVIDHKNAEWLKKAADQGGNGGLEHTHFWSVSNLSGAKGDTNNIKANMVGLYSPHDFNAQNPQHGMKPKAEAAYNQSFDLEKFLANNQVLPAEKLANPTDTVKTESDNPAVLKPVDSVKALPFNENNVLAAAKQAEKAKNPLLAYVKGSAQADANLMKALNYLQENGLATPVEIDSQHAQQMKFEGMRAQDYAALDSLGKPTDNVQSSSFLSSFNGKAVGQQADKFAKTGAYKSVDPNSPEAVVNFLKQSNVGLNAQSEAAINALLRGQPIPELSKPVEKAKEVQAEKPAPVKIESIMEQPIPSFKPAQSPSESDSVKPEVNATEPDLVELKRDEQAKPVQPDLTIQPAKIETLSRRPAPAFESLPLNNPVASVTPDLSSLVSAPKITRAEMDPTLTTPAANISLPPLKKTASKLSILSADLIPLPSAEIAASSEPAAVPEAVATKPTPLKNLTKDAAAYLKTIYDSAKVSSTARPDAVIADANAAPGALPSQKILDDILKQQSRFSAFEPLSAKNLAKLKSDEAASAAEAKIEVSKPEKPTLIVSTLDLKGLKTAPPAEAISGSESTAPKIKAALTADEVQAAINEAKERNVPLVVDRPSNICEGQSCRPVKLSPDKAQAIAEQAVVIQIRRQGLGEVDAAKYPEVAELSKHFPKPPNFADPNFKLEDMPHKTTLDLEVFDFSSGKLSHVTGDSLKVEAKSKEESKADQSNNKESDAEEKAAAARAEAEQQAVAEREAAAAREAAAQKEKEIAETARKAEEKKQQELAEQKQRDEAEAAAKTQRERDALVQKQKEEAEAAEKQKEIERMNLPVIETDINRARENALKYNTLLVIQKAGEGCPPCIRMEREVYGSQAFRDSIKGKAQIVIVTQDMNGGAITEGHGIQGTSLERVVAGGGPWPQTITMIPNGKGGLEEADRKVGFHNPADGIIRTFESFKPAPVLNFAKGIGDINSAAEVVAKAKQNQQSILSYAEHGKKMKPSMINALNALQEMKGDKVGILIIDRTKAEQIIADKNNPPEKRHLLIGASGYKFSADKKFYSSKTNPHFDAVSPDFYGTKPTENTGYSVNTAQDFLNLVSKTGVELSQPEKERLARIFSGK